MSSSIHCLNGCTRKNADDNTEPAPAAYARRLCQTCINRLHRWLTEIPERYALVPQYLTQSADLDNNPETKATKRPVAPTPIRVGALDLLDTRLIRKWQGTEPTLDRRGALGTLLAIANNIRTDQGSTPRTDSTVLHEADTIRGQLDWLTAQEWAPDAYTEIRTLHRDLGDAVGEYPRKPVGVCYVVPEGAEAECGGPLLPTYTGVHCPRCHTTWGHDELRRLGNALNDGRTA